ncbi:hypothetical protein [Actinomadura rugatobispora]|uniref:DUF308 domain-containing protein n=1 Tax=Actinomadura rugatobispora TaxID=1994 RepID=A0ABW1AJ28_9ACTN|nr:hypothetical protein GCM10010200_033270 [Actinomadura rugatobispora]
MSRRVLGWCGLIVGVIAIVAVAALFVIVGLDRADKIASSLGALIGLAGLGVAVFGLISSRREDRDDDAQRATPGSVHNTIGGPVSGTAIQAKNVHLGALPPPNEERES